MALNDYISQVANNAPGLLRYPDMALAAAQSKNPGQTAQVLAQTAQVAAQEQAVQKASEHHNWFTGLLKDIGHGAGTALEYAGKPLHEVQHDYRYIHDLWVKSDPISATLATLGIAGGAAVGTLAGGVPGAFLGAGVAAIAEGKLAGAGAFDPISTEYKKIYEDSDKAIISPVGTSPTSSDCTTPIRGGGSSPPA